MSIFPYWFSECYSVDGLTSSWAQLTQTDNKLLEHALESNDKIVHIENKRSSVDLETRTLRGCYDFPPTMSCSEASLLPARRLIRAGWLYIDSTSGKPVPLSEEVSRQIEDWFDKIKDGESAADGTYSAETEVEVVLNCEREGKAVTYRVLAEKGQERERRATNGQRLGPTEGLTASTRQKVDGFSIKMYPKSQASMSNLLKIGSIVLQRGVTQGAATHPEEAWGQLEEDHLVLVVHGIGQFYFAGTDDSFERCVGALRKNLMEQRCALDEEDAASARTSATTLDEAAKSALASDSQQPTTTHTALNPNNHKRVECLGVEWYNEVHHDATSGMNEGLAKVTLPSIPSIRKVTHDVAMDVMLYMTPEFRDRIVRIVVEKINFIYQQFCKLNPSFVKNGGKCSIVGHSLGTVIVYDILSSQALAGLPPRLKLSFSPTAYFSMGSPLGLFLTLRNSAAKVHNSELAMHASREGSGREVESEVESQGGVRPAGTEGGRGVLRNDDVLSADYSFPTCTQFFNIFNKNDPVAYRLEPLADSSLQSRDPQIVPHHDGGLRTQYMLKSVASSISETFKSFTSPSGWFRSSTSTATLQVTNTSFSSAPAALSDASEEGDQGLPPLQLLQRLAARQRRLRICPLEDIAHVRINGGRRFDYMLQESMIEGANEYLSSLSSHTSYFDQKDVARFIMSMLI